MSIGKASPMLRKIQRTETESSFSDEYEHHEGSSAVVSLDDLMTRAYTFLHDYENLESHMQRELFLREQQVQHIRASPTYISCMKGELIDEDFQRYHSMPPALMKECSKLTRAIVEVRAMGRAMFSNNGRVLLKRLEFFLVVYKTTLDFSPELFVRPLLECFIAQTVELVAMLNAGRALRNSGAQEKLKNALETVMEHVADLGAQSVCLLRGDFLVDIQMCLPLEDISQALGEMSLGHHSELKIEDVVAMMESVEGHSSTLSEILVRARAEFTQLFGEQLYLPMQELLLSPDWGIVKALCLNKFRAPDVETVVRPLYNLFRVHRREMDLVHWAIDQDVKSGIREANTLFRTPSTATRLLRTVFYSSEGREFLKLLLLPTIKRAFKAGALEVDPKRVVPSDDIDIKKNIKSLINVFEDLVNHVLKSIHLVPVTIRKFLLYARNTVIGQANVQDSTLLVVASLFFLRFVCPALVTPRAYGLISEHPEMEQQRALILISKMLQNCASGVQFDGSKEEYMMCFNDVVTKYQSEMGAFYEGLINAMEIGKQELKSKRPTKRMSGILSSKRKARGKQAELLRRQADGAVTVRSVGLVINELATHTDTVRALRGKPHLARASATATMSAKAARKIWRHASECRVLAMLDALLQSTDSYGDVFREVVGRLGHKLPSDMLNDEQIVNLMQQLQGTPMYTYEAPRAAEPALGGAADQEEEEDSSKLLHVNAMMADRLTAVKPRREYKRAKRVAFLAAKVCENGLELERLLRSKVVQKGEVATIERVHEESASSDDHQSSKRSGSASDDGSTVNADDQEGGGHSASLRKASRNKLASKKTVVIKAMDLVTPQTLVFARYIVYLLRRLREIEMEHGSGLPSAPEIGVEVQAELASFSTAILTLLNSVLLNSTKDKVSLVIADTVKALTDACLVVTDRVLELLNLLRESCSASDSQVSGSQSSLLSLESPRVKDELQAKREKKTARTHRKLISVKRPSIANLSAIALPGTGAHPLASVFSESFDEVPEVKSIYHSDPAVPSAKEKVKPKISASPKPKRVGMNRRGRERSSTLPSQQGKGDSSGKGGGGGTAPNSPVVHRRVKKLLPE